GVLQRLGLSSAQSTSDWETIKSNIDGIKRSAERIKPLLWLLPAAVKTWLPQTPVAMDAAMRIEAFADAAAPRFDQAITFVGVVGKIHDAMTVYVEATKALGGDQRTALAFSALSYAMTFVPVLGDFYGTIVQKIPGLINNWREFMTDYTRRYD